MYTVPDDTCRLLGEGGVFPSVPRVLMTFCITYLTRRLRGFRPFGLKIDNFFSNTHTHTMSVRRKRPADVLFVGGPVRPPDLLLPRFQRVRSERPDDHCLHVDDVDVRARGAALLSFRPFRLFPRRPVRLRFCARGRRRGRGPFRRAQVVLPRRRCRRHRWYSRHRRNRFLFGVRRRGRRQAPVVIVAGCRGCRGGGKVKRRLRRHIAVHLRRFHGVCAKTDENY